jgi:hypothetical protein
MQKTMHEYAVTTGRKYQFGVDQNIGKTEELQEAMKYYFAATVYVTSDQQKYGQLVESQSENKSVKVYFLDEINCFTLDTIYIELHQHYLWAFEVEKVTEDEKIFDMSHNKLNNKKWQISLSYGRWYFNTSAKSKEKFFLYFPGNMKSWNLSCARYLTEQLSVNANLRILGRQIKSLPDVASIISGANIEIEGGGIFLLTVSVGMDYH